DERWHVLAQARAGAARCRRGRLARLEPELAARDNDCGAADLDLRRRRVTALDAGIELRRTPNLLALANLDLLAPLQPSMPNEMQRERSRRGARRGVFRDAAVRREHARLPLRSGAGEAVDADRVWQLREPSHVRPQCSNLLLRAEAD